MLSGPRDAVNAAAVLNSSFKSSKTKTPHAGCNLQAESHKYFVIDKKNLFLGISFSLGIW